MSTEEKDGGQDERDWFRGLLIGYIREALKGWKCLKKKTLFSYNIQLEYKREMSIVLNEEFNLCAVNIYEDIHVCISDVIYSKQNTILYCTFCYGIRIFQIIPFQIVPFSNKQTYRYLICTDMNTQNRLIISIWLYELLKFVCRISGKMIS